ncbi:carboxymuconolactone decarboxylase family protein [Motilimonas pumila]|uniref:Carboxymuconolactone decarboxylase family protein n=1 Tax=Motilimonas pumila TaxID=2303987 RepID=A0A418YG03_9GAMM|nr:carboxymuconolactone decarboxylase family protein [Motilimonas pumila]RJG48464.1 carboxymuconolactone decarboxylase family protein [Motilimonas pumila]
MRVNVKPLKQYPFWLKPFFATQKKNYGQVLIPGMLWGRSPKLFAAVACLYGVINRRRSPITPVIRSLVTVKVSQINACHFCVDINSMTLAKRAGSEDKVLALHNWRHSDLFDDIERAVLAYTEAMTDTQQGVTDQHTKDLKAWFNDDELVELTGLIAFQNMSAKFNAALDVPSQGFCHLPTGSQQDG